MTSPRLRFRSIITSSPFGIFSATIGTSIDARPRYVANHAHADLATQSGQHVIGNSLQGANGEIIFHGITSVSTRHDFKRLPSNVHSTGTPLPALPIEGSVLSAMGVSGGIGFDRIKSGPFGGGAGSAHGATGLASALYASTMRNGHGRQRVLSVM